MKNYYQAKCSNAYTEEGYLFLCSSEQKLKKDDCVVVELDSEVSLAYITKSIDELKALTSGNEVNTIIQFVDLSVYKQQREGRLQKAILIERLEGKLREVKLIETFKKYADKDSEMQALMEMFQDVNRGKTTPDIEDISE